MKKLFSVLLAVILVCGTLPAVISSAAVDARLYNVYADGMIFQQNSEAIFAGTASSGARISAVLKDAGGNVSASGEASAGADGTFTVSFDSPAGSFDAYTVELSANGIPFCTLSNIVFGEVWLSAGQSNMSYAYVAAEDYVSPGNAVTEEKSWIRLFWCPEMAQYNGSAEKSPALPQNEIPECCWFDGNDQRCDGFSAVSYFFALDLAKTLDVPLGIVALPLGGSSILSWLPREAVEGSEAISARAKANNTYYTLEDWDEDEANDFQTMTALYNKKVYPVRNFRYSGMIWYQGESDIILNFSAAEYAEAVDLMQDYYSELFDQNGKLPFIWTQLASFYYFDNESNTMRNIDFAEIQQARPESRALVTGYDYASTYGDPGPIHPQTKKPIGERMSFAAQRLVYGASGDYTLPTVKSYTIRDGGISVTFRDVGDGLCCDAALRGFAIAGEDGVYVRANAEITGNDSVFIYNEDIASPVSASYAFAITSDKANLYASEYGEKTLPVSPFMLERDGEHVSYQNNAWTECEEAQSWHSLSRTSYNAYYDTWESKNAEIAITSDAAFDGDAGLRIGGSGSFSVNPLMHVKPEADIYVMSDLNTDWSDYGKLSVMLRNDGASNVDVTLFVNTALVFKYAAAVDGQDGIVAHLPADGEWHRVVFDLTKMYLGGTINGYRRGNDALPDVSDVRFSFSSDGDAQICLDDVRFIPADKAVEKTSFEKVRDFFAWILRLFESILDKLGVFFNCP
ncbi:MAG: hypothetical protein IK118_07725 [Clostridia bacterium]|nr:hypothetical protein [Clostridia bacterium]